MSDSQRLGKILLVMGSLYSLIDRGFSFCLTPSRCILCLSLIGGGVCLLRPGNRHHGLRSRLRYLFSHVTCLWFGSFAWYAYLGIFQDPGDACHQLLECLYIVSRFGCENVYEGSQVLGEWRGGRGISELAFAASLAAAALASAALASSALRRVPNNFFCFNHPRRYCLLVFSFLLIFFLCFFLFFRCQSQFNSFLIDFIICGIPLQKGFECFFDLITTCNKLTKLLFGHAFVYGFCCPFFRL